MDIELFKTIVGYLDCGVLGAICFVLVIVVKKLYKRNVALTDERESLHKEFQSKLETITTRELNAALSYGEKNREIASNTQAVLAALTRRGDGDGQT